jgi:anthranilate phosphoribosyltransferase
MFDLIFENALPQDEVRAFLIELYNRGETAVEIAQAVTAMRQHSIKLPISKDLQEKAIDIVGTGGDKSFSFNISSTVALLLASCGSFVAKHGNKSITSKSGSADMLEALGINLNLSVESQVKMFEECGFVFMYAVNHHPAMKYIMPIRKSIPHRTIFNILGPLTNPSGAKKLFMGVYEHGFIDRISNAILQLDIEKALIVSSNDGMDEISLSDITFASKIENKTIQNFVINPKDFGFDLCKKDDIVGGEGVENAKITRAILSGELKGAKKDIVILNAGAALFVDGKVDNIQDGMMVANEAIASGKAFEKLLQIIKISNSF